MSRNLSSEQITASNQTHRAVAPLIEAFFDSGTLRFTLAPWDITYGSVTYLSAVTLMEVKPARESAASTEGLEFVLSGVSPAIIAVASQEQYRGRIVRLSKAYFNVDTNTIISEPKPFFVGRIKSMPIIEQNNSCRVSVLAEHYDAELGRACPTRLNDGDQQRFFPGDLGCQHAETMTEKNIVWPDRDALRV